MRLEYVKELEELRVYRGLEFAGFLRRSEKGSEFEFDPDYLLNHKNGIAFHINGKKNLYHFQGESLPPFFAGLLPEGLRLKTLTKKIKTSEDDLFSILAAVGARCVGDVYAKSMHSEDSLTSEDRPVDFKDVDFYKLFDQSLSEANSHSQNEALAGVQEKLSASMISFPLRISKKNKSYILKLNPKDKPNLVNNEFLSLTLADKCGLEVNHAVIVEDSKGQQGLLVERFDRALDKESGEVIMLHQEDGCQILDRFSSDKYRLSFKDVLIGIQQYATAPKPELLRAFQLYAFSYLIGNGDLHAKNVSLQILKPFNKITLTPAYDIICTYIYGDHKMALKVNGRNTNIKRNDFIELGEFFGLPHKSVSSMLGKLIKKTTEHHEVMFGCMDSKQKVFWLKMFESRTQDLSQV